MADIGCAVSKWMNGFKLLAGLILAALPIAFAGCGGSSSGESALLNTAAPTTLTPKRDETAAGGGNALIASVDEPELRKAVERYRLTKRRGQSHIDFAGVDLNSDGNPEALVLFAGEDWCLKTGCSLVVFQLEKTGYRPVSHITRVRPPIMVGPDESFGWNDLIVNTGGGPSPVRAVRLGFTGKGYPRNALLQPEALTETQARSQGVLAESASFTAFTRQASQADAAR